MSFLQNITFRRPRTQSLNEKHDEDILNNTSITIDVDDTTTGSLPNISCDSVDEQVYELKNQIDKLKTDLQSANDEIVNLSLENTQLKKTIQALESKHEMYKKVTKNLSNNMLNSPNRGTPKKTITPINAVSDNSKKCPILEKQKVANEGSPEINNCSNTRDPKIDVSDTRSPQIRMNNELSAHKSNLPKIAILSTNKNTDTLAAAKKLFPRFNICHYLTTNCSLERMVHSLESKIKDYNMNDYCVVVIGQTDFEFTNNYFELVINLRQILLKNMHTNVILCLPTFKCGKYTNMFNSRIETFNSLLNLDVLTHDHAYLIDSNKNLSYDFDMFDNKTGNVNKYGMQIMFNDVLSLINDIAKYHKRINEERRTSEEPLKTDLFRE